MKRLKYLAILTILALAASGFQLIKTSLNITVRDGLGNTVEGATDEKGIVKFKDLKDIAYFVLAEKDDLNNFGGGEKTGKLEAKRINKVTVVIQ
jgi:hypothetical protein